MRSHPEPDSAPQFVSSTRVLPRVYWLALMFGLFLGLAILKFGNPVILDEKVGTPTGFQEVLNYSWPARWAFWGMIPLLLAVGGFGLSATNPFIKKWWLWALPLVWLGWQFISAMRTVDWSLTEVVLWHFVSCVGCYFAGAIAFCHKRIMPWLLAGVLVAFAWCLVRAANQKWIEFPREHADLLAGQQAGWTNYPPDLVVQMKSNGLIVTTNGVEIANPLILAKYAKGRVHGTMVYPNALASLILLLLPASLTLAVTRSRNLRSWIRLALVSLVFVMGFGGLIWTGSKLGWLVAIAMFGVWLLRYGWPRGLKILAIVCVIGLGMAVFGWRFHAYLSSGARSLGARFDYWRAAVQTSVEYPVLGSGPGTFQRPYSQLKSSESEMARLAHNDYLEQFSDSGLIGGFSYLAWICTALFMASKRAIGSGDVLLQSLTLGVAGWFVQGVGEFGLYIPALAWLGFTFLGSFLGSPCRNAVDTRLEAT